MVTDSYYRNRKVSCLY